jgi:hypothetical protein
MIMNSFNPATMKAKVADGGDGLQVELEDHQREDDPQDPGDQEQPPSVRHLAADLLDLALHHPRLLPPRSAGA